MTANPFLITGLPRSRTAWFAVAASQAPAMCWHEPIKTRWQDCFDLWESSPYMWAGISDCGLGFHLPEIIDRAAPRILIVERDPKQVKASLARIGLPADRVIDLLHADLAAVKSDLVRRISFDAGKNEISGALEWLLPGLKVDVHRIRELEHLNIQENLNLTLTRAAGLDPVAVLGERIARKLELCQ